MGSTLTANSLDLENMNVNAGRATSQILMMASTVRFVTIVKEPHPFFLTIHFLPLILWFRLIIVSTSLGRPSYLPDVPSAESADGASARRGGN